MKDPYIFELEGIKDNYIEQIPAYAPCRLNKNLYAYTDKKEYAKEFRMTHSKDAIIMKKMKLDRDGVRLLAKEFQNNIIRKETLTTKDENFNPITIKMCMTEKEYMVSENGCYSHVEDLWKYVWDPILSLNDKYIKSLNCLGYSFLSKRLEDGNCTYVPNIEADILGSFIYYFKHILTIGDE